MMKQLKTADEMVGKTVMAVIGDENSEARCFVLGSDSFIVMQGHMNSAGANGISVVEEIDLANLWTLGYGGDGADAVIAAGIASKDEIERAKSDREMATHRYERQLERQQYERLKAKFG